MKLKTPWTGRAMTIVGFSLVHFLCAVRAHSQTPTPTPASSVASAGKPTPKPAPVERHEAPAGMYYLTEDTVIPLKNGIRGIPAGTEVRLVKDNGNTLQVAEGENEFTVKKTQVTNDLDLAAIIQKRTAAIDSINERTLQQQEAILIKLQQDEVEFLRTHPLATPTPTPAPGNPR